MRLLGAAEISGWPGIWSPIFPHELCYFFPSEWVLVCLLLLSLARLHFVFFLYLIWQLNFKMRTHSENLTAPIYGCLIRIFTIQVQSQESIGVLHYLSGGAWDPHDRNIVAAFCDSSLQCWDLRTMKYVCCGVINLGHREGVFTSYAFKMDRYCHILTERVYFFCH